jgi:hypothetical protein
VRPERASAVPADRAPWLPRVLFIVIGLAAAACSSTEACIRGPGGGSCLHILFIGNSYIYLNDLPHTFAQLARAGGRRVETGVAAQGGWTLSAHAGSAETLNKLKSSKWDIVVLQEQSEVPASEQARTQGMYPAGRSLVRQIEEGGATPIFFLTWAHRDGWPEGGLPGYDAMQSRINDGYLRIAQELGVSVAPVGDGWSMAKGGHPELELWQGDGSHPTEEGTYLAACVFYATIFRQSPEGLSYRGHVPKETAVELQKTAANVVLKDPNRWNLR